MMNYIVAAAFGYGTYECVVTKFIEYNEINESLLKYRVKLNKEDFVKGINIIADLNLKNYGNPDWRVMKYDDLFPPQTVYFSGKVIPQDQAEKMLEDYKNNQLYWKNLSPAHRAANYATQFFTNNE